MMERIFHLRDNNTSIKMEILGGLSTFLTTMYILFVNGVMLADAGMPTNGVFISTALSAAVCTLGIALFANVPFAMAPGMGINVLFAQTICLGMGYHWREALAISLLASVLHTIVMLSPLRKAFVMKMSTSFSIAASAGLGLFIANVGLKNAGLVNYTISEGQYIQTPGHIVADSTATLSFLPQFGKAQLVMLFGTMVLFILLMMERKNGMSYGALPLSILSATFVGLPFNVMNLQAAPIPLSAAFEEFREIFFGFWGSPGIFTIFSDTSMILRTVLIILVLSLTNILDTLATLIGIGHIKNATIFDRDDRARFIEEKTSSKLDRAFIAGAVGSGIAPLFGSSPSAIYLESATGVISGARTGLAGVVTALMFLLCIPFGGFFKIIPIEAVSPAIVFAGFCMMRRVQQINWMDMQEAYPVFLILLITPLTNSIIDGLAIATIFLILTHLFSGKFKEIHAVHILIAGIYLLSKVGEQLL